MNEEEKERLIKKDIVSIENRVRHAFNQGYEMGLKERQNTCEDAISRQAAINAVDDIIADYIPILLGRYEALPLEMALAINRLPSVNPQHTEAEIQKMQELEQAEIQKAYEIGKAERQESEDAISRQSAIFLASDLKQDLPDDERIADMVMAHNEGILEYQTQLSLLPSVNPQPCEDVISRKSIKQKLQEHHDFFVNAYGGFSNLPQNDKSRVDEISNCIAMVVNEPPVTPQPRTGNWIHFASGDDCSECGWSTGRYISPSKYCPGCGCLMVEAQESESDEE